jgi:glucosamine--fructose-6-phosphate aminotransferase (isomerizing)
MHKEIFETPKVFTDTMLGRINRKDSTISFEEVNIDFKRIGRIIIVACGTSYHAGMIGRYYLEQLSRIPVEVDYASEFRYRNPVLREDDLIIVISQSGETADTLGALKDAKERGIRSLAICNVMNSSIARLADNVIYTRAGIEIGVASTKAFVAQTEVLLMLAILLGERNGHLSVQDRRHLVEEFIRMPVILKQTLSLEPVIKEISSKFVRAKDFIYLGRGINFPVALEGALKLKEISYIHAEGYAAGEMKHGPIALIDEEVPVLVIANRGSNLKKIISNILEAKSRGGILIGIVSKGDEETRAHLDYYIEVEDVNEYFQPFVNSIPLQLIAYHIADMKGTDVDQPRNLAKSVTVE